MGPFASESVWAEALAVAPGKRRDAVPRDRTHAAGAVYHRTSKADSCRLYGSSRLLEVWASETHGGLSSRLLI
jgi:hypothetical protein